MNFEIAPSPSPIPMVVLSSFKSIEENPALFDFDLFINEDNVIINSTSQIYRSRRDNYILGKKLQVASKRNAENGDLPNFDFQTLFSLQVRKQDQNTCYVLEKPENARNQSELKNQFLQTMPYICLNGHGRINEVKSYPIVEGDIIKLGKLYLRVLQTHLNKRRMPQLPQINERSKVRSDQSFEDDGSVAKLCRICWMESEQDNEVISPCSCKGSCKFVHFHCLKTWFQNKVTSQNNRLVTSYQLAKFECQICKTPLPNKLNVKGREQLLVELRKPEQPYIVLQKINASSKDKKIFVLTPKGAGVKIGRGAFTDLKIKDPTISRLHAIIEFRGGEFVISDMGSRFGTLILMRENIAFDKIMCLQWRNKLYKLQAYQTIKSQAQAYVG